MDRFLTGLSGVADIFGVQTGFSARAQISRKFSVYVSVIFFVGPVFEELDEDMKAISQKRWSKNGDLLGFG